MHMLYPCFLLIVLGTAFDDLGLDSYDGSSSSKSRKSSGFSETTQTASVPAPVASSTAKSSTGNSNATSGNKSRQCSGFEQQQAQKSRNLSGSSITQARLVHPELES